MGRMRIDLPEFKTLQTSLEKTLQIKLKQTKDEFLPADYYMTKWDYLYDDKDRARNVNYLQANRK